MERYRSCCSNSSGDQERKTPPVPGADSVAIANRLFRMSGLSSKFPDLNFDCQRALVGYGTSSTRAKWRSYPSARRRAARKLVSSKGPKDGRHVGLDFLLTFS
jgi:hypothetical protein